MGVYLEDGTYITASEYVMDDEPVCVNCNDEGCGFCEDYDEPPFVEQPEEWDEDDEDCYEDYEYDGQPDEHTEWQDFMGGDEDPHDYDQFEGRDEW